MRFCDCFRVASIDILSRSGAAAKWFTPLLNKAMHRYEINTRPRIAAFIAQVGYESGELRNLREVDSGLGDRGARGLSDRLGDPAAMAPVLPLYGGGVA